MGLLDILNGMQNGPQGQRQPSAGQSGGMSPVMMALLGLLAYKALKGHGSAAPPAAPGTAPSQGNNPGGMLGNILGGLFGGGARGPGGNIGTSLPGGLGGLLGGAAAGTVLSRGLENLVRDLHQSGHGATAQSWVGTGPNQDIAPGDLASALGGDTLDELSKRTGVGREDLLGELSRYLPSFVDQLTPQGRVPSEEEASRMV
jgi:uncharacterized protein YidB (DUF937 family)